MLWLDGNLIDRSDKGAGAYKVKLDAILARAFTRSTVRQQTTGTKTATFTGLAEQQKTTRAKSDRRKAGNRRSCQAF